MRDGFLVDSVLKSIRHKKREEPWQHVPYEQELILLSMVKKGDVEGLRNRYGDFDLRNHLSSDEIRQRQYELVAIVTLITRWAVEGGLDVETAYDLADAYINAADVAKDTGEVISLIREAPQHFAYLVRTNKRKHQLPKPVLQCFEYIESNLHSTISMQQLSDYTGRNTSYLSTLFKKEVGIPISKHISNKKLEEAKALLSNTDMPIAQIANLLSYCTQSYFSHIFVTETGETPREYRLRTFRNVK